MVDPLASVNGRTGSAFLGWEPEDEKLRSRLSPAHVDAGVNWSATLGFEGATVAELEDEDEVGTRGSSSKLKPEETGAGAETGTEDWKPPNDACVDDWKPPKDDCVAGADEKLSELRSSIKEVCGAAFTAGGGGMAGLTAAGAGAALKSPKSSSLAEGLLGALDELLPRGLKSSSSSAAGAAALLLLLTDVSL